MASVTYFSPSFPSSTASSPNLPSSLKPSNKRKRAPTTSNSSTDDGQNDSLVDRLSSKQRLPISRATEPDNPSLSIRDQAHSQSSPSITDLEPASKRHHDIDSDQTRKLSSSNTRRTVKKELMHLKPPVHISRAFRSQSISAHTAVYKVGLRRRHLATLTAVIHRCIMQGDYRRAGRAWGLLLRSELNGHSMDPRFSNRWGLGAEILLHGAALPAERNADSGSFGLNEMGSFPLGRLGTATVSERVKDYYERLIVQYPYRKISPHTTGPPDFYLAMFSVWIYSVHHQHTSAKTDLATVGESLLDDDIALGEERENPSVPDPTTLFGQRRERIHQKTLLRAQQIDSRLDHLSSPPYTDRADFWKLKGMVALWMADLFLQVSSPYAGRIEDSSDENFATDGDILLHTSSEADGAHMTEKRAKFLSRAQFAFDKVVSLGGSLYR